MSKNTEVKHVVKLTLALDAPAADVEKAIASIANRGAKLQADMHSAACASLNHAAMHNDPTLLNRLLNAMPKSSRRNSLMVWALKFGNVALNADKATKGERPLVYLKGQPADITSAVDTPFWEMKNFGGESWVYADYIKNVMAKLDAQAKKGDAQAQAALAALQAVAVNTMAAA